jgi:alpha-tubulin suppressor-like RCC1 family protein
MKGHKFILRAAAFWLLAIFLFACDENIFALPLKLTVEPKGTNQVGLTFGPVVSGIYYQVLARTNGPEGHWIPFDGYIGGSNETMSVTSDLGKIQGLTLTTLKTWKFVVGRWDDPFGDELPTLYKELVLRTDPYAPADPYSNPMGDGWNNMQKLQNNMDPLSSYLPPPPQVNVKIYGGTNDARHGSAIVTWQVPAGPVPDYFVVERANRTLRPRTNDSTSAQPGPPGRNRRFPTNFPPGYRTMNGRPGWQREDPLITGPFEVVARTPGRAGLSEYRFVDTNIDTLFQPIYQLQPHYSPPLRAHLRKVDAAEIRNTILSVSAQQTTNGYALTASHPIPHARYLLLVHDKNDLQWRAAGYFESGTNRNPIYLHVDKKGMMSDGQSPIAMPEVKFLPDVVEAEFSAGWGEDSDGDGLPDIYEVLVTHTAPDDADTGNAGILDGFKEMSGDGWSNLEKFRRRADPLQTAQPPPTVELKEPTGLEIMQAVTPKTDLGCEVQIDIRTNGATVFQPLEKVPWMLSKTLNYRHPNDHTDFDVRISWRFAEFKPTLNGDRPYPGAPAWYETVEPVVTRINVLLLETFKSRLAASPPLSHIDASNRMVSIDHAYREGEFDKGVAMAEMMALEDNQSQDFYGKVVDQNGKPVAAADVTAEVSMAMGRGDSQKTQTDSAGLFQFTGLRGRSLNVVPAKKGFQIEGHGLGLKGLHGSETSPSNRTVYTMWKLKGPEPMIHYRKLFTVKSDDRVYTLDLLSKNIEEGTNNIGDFHIQFQCPPQIKPRENYDWSFAMTGIGGGVIEVTNDDYLNEAPTKGYQSKYEIHMASSGPEWRGTSEATFYLKSRNGKAYGHFHIRIESAYRDGSSMEIESYINPSDSRNLEFEPSKEIQYAQKTQVAPPSPPVEVPKTSRILSTNLSGQVVSWGSMMLPFVNPGTRFVAIAAGGEHSLALQSDGTVIAWGRNISGEANVPSGLSNVVAIAAGGRSDSGFSVALRRDGRVFAWGGEMPYSQTNVPTSLTNVIAIASGTQHGLALKKDGTVAAWGFNFDNVTVSPPGLSNVVAISAGAEHSVALKSNGTVVAWGRNQWGQANVPTNLNDVIAISAGSYFNLALRKDGTVVEWGGNAPEGLSNVVAIAAGPWHALALKKDGTVVAWGRETFGGTKVPVGLSNVVAISAGGDDYGGHSLALKSDGTIVGWGNKNYGQSLSPGELTNVVSIAAGLNHCLAIRDDGSLIAWGGQEHEDKFAALVPAGLTNVIAAAGGWHHSLAVEGNGEVIIWGFDLDPKGTIVSGLSNIGAVAAGYAQNLALTGNGTIMAWENSSAPHPVSGLSNILAIACSTHHSLLLQHDGTVLMRSDSLSISNLPNGLSDVTAIAAGGEYEGNRDLALKRDGTVVAWGDKSGQTDVPAGLSNVIAIATSANHSLAMKKDGTLIAWGENKYGQTNVPPGLGKIIGIAATSGSTIAIVAVTNKASGTIPHTLIVGLAILAICALMVSWLLIRRTIAERHQKESANE